MTFFKKALLATAITAAASGAQAVQVASDTLKMSQEGVQIGNQAHEVAFGIDFLVEATTPSASTIELEFGNNVDLSDLATILAGQGEDVKVWNDPEKGKGTITHNGLAPADFSDGADTGVPVIEFFYGTGSFTFDRFNVDLGDTATDEDVLTFDVNLGNPVLTNSAFRMTFMGTSNPLGWLPTEPVSMEGASVDVAGASQVCYESTQLDGSVIEAGCDDIAEEESQFAFSVTKEWDGIIERAVQRTFVEDYDTVLPLNTTADTVQLSVKNDQTLVAAVTGVSSQVSLEGNYDHGVLGEAPLVSGDFASSIAAVATATQPTLTDLDDVHFPLTAAEVGSAGIPSLVDVTFTGDPAAAGLKVIPVTGPVDAELSFSSTQAAAAGVTWDYSDYAGQWMLDATIINVPYLPVGYEGTSSSVHFANEEAPAANVIATAIDDQGDVYGPFDLGDLPGNTVTKFSQGFIMTEMGIPAERKVSITFNIDADNGDVNAYAFTSSSVGRTEISNSQLKGIKDGAM